MNDVVNKIRLKIDYRPRKFGNVWEHSLSGSHGGDFILIKIYTKETSLNPNGFGIIFIMERYIQSRNMLSEDFGASLFGWVELTKEDYFDQYEIIST